jgi:hypothetical protein
MSDPLGFTREAAGHLFQDNLALDDILELLATRQDQLEAGEDADTTPAARRHDVTN